MTKKKALPITSSAAEYLTYIASTGETSESLEMRYEDENIWMTQKKMASLYEVDIQTITALIQKIYEDAEWSKEETIREVRIVEDEGDSQTPKSIMFYNLQIVIAVGFRLGSERAVRLRKWFGTIIKDYTIQGWAMDKERLKKGHMFTEEFFERQLQQIWEIRLSERKFYQKVTDLYATAFDYDKDAKTTQQFYKTVQDKMHYAVHRHTTAELIAKRANAEKEHMGLTSWELAPNGKILKTDVTIANNYLSEEERDELERIVALYLDYAEFQAKRHIPMSMEDWAKRLDGFLEFNGDEILTGSGKISAEEAKLHAQTEYEKYRIVQDRQFRSDFDRFLESENQMSSSVET
uniref:RhuM family protein n=1 Tax=Eubacterium cellulosolvens TaxID=29322 RepID=UPI000480E2EA|nr:RhuM family protein [[Eubacterium] cellulosolvens]